MQNLKQRRVNDQGLRIAYEFGQEGAPQGLEVAPRLAYLPMEGGRVKTHHSGEQIREEPGSLAQERALALDAPQLLKEGEGYDLRIRELLEGLVVAAFGVEVIVSVIYSAKKHGQSLFQKGQLWGKLGEGHLKLLWTGRSRMALVLPYKPRNTHLGEQCTEVLHHRQGDSADHVEQLAGHRLRNGA
jgi:hypothetical protein